MNSQERYSFRSNFNRLVRELRISNRHFVQNPIVEKIKNFVQDSNQYDIITQQNSLFRARICTTEDEAKLGLKDGYDGFDEKGSGAPPASLCGENRANGKGIKRLYVAESANTAVAEIKPLLGNAVSVAEMKTLSTFEVLDLAKPSENPDIPTEIDYLRHLINMQFADICSGDSYGYSFTQWFSDLVENLGRNMERGKNQKRGIKYSSAMDLEGKNLVIFGLWEDSGTDNPFDEEHDSESFFGIRAINSKVYLIKDVKYELVEKSEYVEI